MMFKKQQGHAPEHLSNKHCIAYDILIIFNIEFNYDIKLWYKFVIYSKIQL